MYVIVSFEVTTIVVTSNPMKSNFSKSDYMLLMLHAKHSKIMMFAECEQRKNYG